MYKFFKGVAAVLFLVFVGGGGCSRVDDLPADPKERLKSYISDSFSIAAPADKKKLVGYLSGDAKIRLLALTDEEFAEDFITEKKEFLKLVFREMNRLSDTEVNLTYELTYSDRSKGKQAKVTNRKLAHMIFKEGQWYISDVRNIKEMVEFKDELTLP